MLRKASKSLITLSLLVLPSTSLVILPHAPAFTAVAKPSLDHSASSNPQPPHRPSTSSNDNDDDDDSHTPLPLVIWHGLGDSSTSEGMSSIGALISQIHPGTYVYPIYAGTSPSDASASWFGDLNPQLESICTLLATDPILSTAPAIDAIGFSQGGQFLRAYIERCSHRGPRVRNLLTFGSQHNGIAVFQKCKGYSDFLCSAAQFLIRSGIVWGDSVQKKVIPAQYYRPAADYATYLEKSNFLADVNNERELKNETYRENLMRLENFVMLVFDEDKTVVPKESGWFAEAVVDDDEDGGSTRVEYLNATAQYKEDWLGLKTLDQRGALHFGTLPGAHMHLGTKDLTRLFEEFLGPVKRGKKAEQGIKKGGCHHGLRPVHEVDAEPFVFEQDL